MTNHLKPLFFIILILNTFLLLAQKPNIILIMTDDQGWFDAGFNGNEEIITPNLDKLAKSGVIFDRFYSASAVCSPTRASVITGRNPLRIGIPTANAGHMKEEEITLPEILKGNGYATGHFGKWHLGTLTKTVFDANRGGREKFLDDYTVPTSHGYDAYFCSESKVPTYDPLVFPSKFDEGESKRLGWKAVESDEETTSYGTAFWDGEGQRVTDNLEGDDTRIIMDRVIPFIEKSNEKDSPFFTTIWIHTPHLPVVSDLEHRNMYAGMSLAEQIYFGTITAMDEQIGRLWSKLEELGIEEETMIWFCSDNGPEDRTPGSAGVFRERKRSLYEGGVRVPAFVVWKNKFDGGRRVDYPSVTSDYLPTILDVLDLKKPKDRPLDGVSLLKIIEGKNKKRIKPIGFIFHKKTSWVTNRYKLISTDNGITFELYDLLNDKEEQNDIILKKPRLAEKMKNDLITWRTSVKNSSNGEDYN